MIEGIPRISVLVITYKQEKIVSRTLDSLIAQRDYLYEICVSDDCSPDGTWEVLKDYQKRFPELIKIHRQDPNVGIFENTEYSWTMPTGDVINEIAGDDVTPAGWYKTVLSYIVDNKIDYKTELFCIYGDYLVVYPNGDTRRCRNKLINKYPDDALRLAWRGLISGHGCCYSRRMLERYEKVSQGRSHVAEFLQDRMRQIYAERNYYVPTIANIYYAGIGVSTRLNEDTLQERKKIRPYAEQYIEKKGIIVRHSDKCYSKYICALFDFRYHHTISNLLSVITYGIRSFDWRYSFAGDGIKTYLFAFLRRFPHKKPISF